MDIPKLKETSRAREYNTYTDTQRAAIVKQYLFDGKSHRRLDEDVLHLNSIEVVDGSLWGFSTILV